MPVVVIYIHCHMKKWSSAEHIVVDVVRGGGDEKIKLLSNCIAVIKKSIFYSITRKITSIFKTFKQIFQIVFKLYRVKNLVPSSFREILVESSRLKQQLLKNYLKNQKELKN